MFDSSKNDVARNVLFGERVKSILFLSMLNDVPISFLLTYTSENKEETLVTRGVVKIVSPGSGAEWQKCFNGSFMLDTDDHIWFRIQDIFSISLSELLDTREFFDHETSLNRVQHLQQVYSSTTNGRGRAMIEIDNATDSKYYKILSYINNAK